MKASAEAVLLDLGEGIGGGEEGWLARRFFGWQGIQLGELTIQHAGAGAGDVIESGLGFAEFSADFVHFRAEFFPLAADAGEDILDACGLLLEAEVLGGLVDDGEHGEEGSGRGEDEFLAQGFIQQAGSGFQQEGVDLFVGDEDEEVVQRLFALQGWGGAVIAYRGFLQAVTDIRDELTGGGGAGFRRFRVEVGEVIIQREFDVHMDDAMAGQEEGVVWAAAGAFRAHECGLLAVVDLRLEPCETEDVLGHALSPLAAGAGVGEGGFEICRGGLQRFELFAGLAQLLLEGGEGGMAGFFDICHQGGDFFQLARHFGLDDGEALVDEALLGGEFLGAHLLGLA